MRYITKRHPVNKKIYQYYFLRSLIESYQSYVEEWLNKTLKDIKEKAIASSEGEKEIEDSIYSQEEYYAYNEIESEDVLFYKAMLIMVYSYYEGIINKMAEDAGVNNRPSCICIKYGKVLSEESMEKTTFIFDYILPLRNHLCHNDSGTKDRDYEKTVKALKYLDDSHCIKAIIQTDSDNQVILEKCSVVSINKDFILDVLDKEHDILKELSEKSGYEDEYIEWQLNK